MNEEIEHIIEKWLSDRENITAEERRIFDTWMQDRKNREKYYELKRIQSAIYAIGKSQQTDQKKGWEKVYKQIRRSGQRLRILPYAAAAMLILSLGVAISLLKNPSTESQPLAQEDQPGNRKQVVLTLSSGQQISLSDTLQPTLEEYGATISQEGSQLVYSQADSTSLPVYNTITIPRGGEYKLTLSDQTVVWLNSESQLTYPVAFKGDTRELQLIGEAFFEVSKDSLRPFIVHTASFDIRVTGTEFNVRSYPDEKSSATLAEGSIQLEKNKEVYRLIPGQQAYLQGEEVKVKEVHLEEAIAWRYDAFAFKETPLEEIMNELSRWYDVDIFYLNPEVKQLHFTAWFRRNSSLTEVIETLKKTQKINIEVKGKTITVKKQS